MGKYNTAEDAFNSLNIGTRFNKVTCKNALKKIADIRNIDYNEYRDFRGFEELAFKLHNNTRGFKFVNKALRIGMTPKGSVVLCADTRERKSSIDFYKEVRQDIVNKANNNNINIEMFEKSYGSLEFQNGWVPPKNTNYHFSGYEQFYRGNIVGLIITP